MVNDAVVAGFIFIDDGKSRAVHGVVYAELFADGFDERGFAGTHRAVEREHAVAADLLDKLPCGFVYAVE